MAGLTENEAERKVKESMLDAEDKRSEAVQQLGVSATSERKSWSYEELVGLTAEEAERKIKEHRPNIRLVEVVPPPRLVTCDYRTDRVRLLIDFSGRVIKTPRPG